MGKFGLTVVSKALRKGIKDPSGVVLKRLGGMPDIAVGLPYSLKFESGARYPGNAKNGRQVRTPPTVIEVGFWNDQGTRTKTGGVHIPPRPFLTGADGDIARGTKRERRALCKAVMDNLPVAEQLINITGSKAASVVQLRIRDWTTPENAPSTVARKKGVNNPLEDTGLLKKMVTYEVRPKEKQ